MKGVFVILDGIGDLPNSKLKNKTPLEAAKTPNLDYLASHGKLGLVYPVKPKFIPESDEAIVSLFGNAQINSSRGQLEVLGADLPLTRGDLALRCNFATIDNFKDGNVLDRRAGRTLSSAEAAQLAKAVNKIKLHSPFIFEPTVQHRAALVFQGGFSDSVSGNDLTYSKGKSGELAKITKCRPLDDDENSQYSANVLNEFIKKSHEVLDAHPVNIKRKEKGLLPANYIFVRGAGSEYPKLKQYPKWVSLGYMPLEKGFSKACGMKVSAFNYPPLKGIDVYENLWKGLRKAAKYSIRTLNKNKKMDYAYLHIKETDLPGHDGKALEKKEMVEYLDKTLFKFLRKISDGGKIKIAVTGDHSTPCKLKNHSAHPVPLLFYDGSKYDKKRFTERHAAKGSIGKIIGNDLLKVVGFNR